ncbi:prepilin-type N-terminal cleavage/methylation domain-containing protein [Parashewanella curva]|uniref:Type II secretion system protein H n=1 Tax=Parashewanella curva TaxID=2338552 RepID=A0A3L8PW96_9GAMM|nr:GspH/FimT family pseudopilin [Parashewanella curva]RLV59634.1 prepilin-type N-terminal cleavage/methylation domain-containing protein [Parashewanella curva]
MKINGFTLVEMMITIAVAAILLTVGVPSLTSFYQQVRAEQNIKQIQSLLAYARNQATSYQRSITICPKSNSTSSTCGNDWHEGMVVYATMGLSGTGGTGSSPTQKTLRQLSKFDDGDSINFKYTSITFSSEGQISSFGEDEDSADMVYCPDNKVSLAKGITIYASGSNQLTETSLNCTTPKN